MKFNIMLRYYVDIVVDAKDKATAYELAQDVNIELAGRKEVPGVSFTTLTYDECVEIEELT